VADDGRPGARNHKDHGNLRSEASGRAGPRVKPMLKAIGGDQGLEIGEEVQIRTARGDLLNQGMIRPESLGQGIPRTVARGYTCTHQAGRIP